LFLSKEFFEIKKIEIKKFEINSIKPISASRLSSSSFKIIIKNEKKIETSTCKSLVNLKNLTII